MANGGAPPAKLPRPKRPASAKSTAAANAPNPPTRNGFIHARAQQLQKPTTRDHVYGAAKLFTPGDIEQEALQYAQLSREELEVTLRVTRTKLKNAEANNATLRADLARCEHEVMKQHRRLEKYLEPQTGHPLPNTDLRRELEKTLLLRQMKTQNALLRSALAERDAEIESLRRSQKGGKVMELSNEKEEYYIETLRLKQVVTELRETLQLERQRRLLGRQAPATAAAAAVGSDEIRREVSRMTAGYQRILSKGGTNTGAANGARAVIRPASAHTAAAAIAAVGSSSGGGGSSAGVRPQSASKGRTSAASIFKDNGPTAAAAAAAAASKQGPGTAVPAATTGDTEGAGDVDELDFFADGADVGAEQLNINLRVAEPFSATATAAAAAAAAPAKATSQPSRPSIPKPTAAAPDRTFTAAPAHASVAGDNGYVAGAALGPASRAEEEEEVEVDAYGYVDEEEEDEEVARASAAAAHPHPQSQPQPAAAAAPPGTYRVGDRVEGDFYAEGDYYPAVVSAVHAADGTCTYDLHYDDGDDEAEVPSSRIRRVPGAGGHGDTAAAAVPAAAPVVQSSSSGGGGGGYAVGQRVEALYDHGTDWYSATVQSGGGGGRYNLLYDDGDTEDDVSEGRIRPLDAGPAPAATTPAPASTGAKADADNVLDSFLNDLDVGSDDDGDVPAYGAAAAPGGDADDGEYGDDDGGGGGGDYGDDFDA